MIEALAFAQRCGVTRATIARVDAHLSSMPKDAPTAGECPAMFDLTAERAGLARAQRERIEMMNAVARRELAPVVRMEEVLAKAASRVAGVFDGIPGMLRRRCRALSAADIALVAAEVTKARNVVAAMRLSDLDETTTSNPDSE